MNASLQRLRIRVSGRVQGVGFRPTVYRLAAGLGLSGFVRNTPGGVLIEAQGAPAALARLRARLRNRPPRHARIERVSVEAAPLVPGETDFAVIPSARSGDPGCGLPPDLALCPECRAELNDPSDRRYGHLFINCTNCGPRFTILRGLPDDRARTAMARFALCAECRR